MTMNMIGSNTTIPTEVETMSVAELKSTLKQCEAGRQKIKNVRKVLRLEYNLLDEIRTKIILKLPVEERPHVGRPKKSN